MSVVEGDLHLKPSDVEEEELCLVLHILPTSESDLLQEPELSGPSQGSLHF